MSAMTSLQDIEVKFEGYIAADVFERTIAETLKNYPDQIGLPFKLILDFSDIAGMDIIASQQLTANIISFRKRNCWPILRLPKKKAVRDFWRAWNYPEAFKEATGMPFSKLVHPDDYIFLSEPQTTYPINSLRKIGDPTLSGSSRADNFFGFFTEHVNSVSPTYLADRETDRWAMDQIQDILKAHLGDSSDYMPNRVVFEAMFNASKHPNASIIQSSSFHRSFARERDGDSRGAPSKKRADNAFVMFFWDNGRSIVETLGGAIEDGVDIREGYSGGYDRNYNFKSKGVRAMGTELERVIDSRQLQIEDVGSDLLLIQSLFPGVTSRPEGFMEDTHHFRSELANDDPNLTKRGMGLFVLMNAVVDVLGGELSIRTDQYFLNVKKLGPRLSKSKGAGIQLTINKMPNTLPRFAGNLIRIKVPSKMSKNKKATIKKDAISGTY